MVSTLRHAFDQAGSVDSVPLNPRYSYLRVIFDGQPVILALGYTDPTPDGVIQVWYGADRQVLRLQNGRLLGLVGLPLEWRSVSLPTFPAWSELANTNQPLQWTRIRDVMPGYRMGIRDALVLRRIDPPAKNELRKLDAAALTWFEESFDLAAPETAANEILPPARYAVDMTDGTGKVVYAEQCLSPNQCLSWQQWSASDQAAANE
ncbi:MAG: YjbF family lipoprotein [Gallionellaceae bacterium]|nr:YjbF family lipoprotein [Gallionellaceae bacterium]